MGMFDDLKCDAPLPDPDMQGRTFQTKSFDDPFLGLYTITVDGRLCYGRRGTGSPVGYHGDIVFYTTRIEEDSSSEWMEYRARFTHDRLESIERIPNPAAHPEATEPSSQDQTNKEGS